MHGSLPLRPLQPRTSPSPSSSNTADMAAPSWDDSHTIHVRDLDGQHRMLATLVRDLHDVIKCARSSETMFVRLDSATKVRGHRTSWISRFETARGAR